MPENPPDSFPSSISYRNALRLATNQFIYNSLIAAKNEWNYRAERGEDDNSGTPLKKAYLHFEQPSNPCACGDSKKPGTHAEFACTITKSSVP
jgi:hypothetical protein